MPFDEDLGQKYLDRPAFEAFLDGSLSIGLQEWAQILRGYPVVTEGAWEVPETYTVHCHETLSLQ